MELIDTYIKRKHGLEPVVYDHQLLESILKETYGIIVYQEQIMKMAQVIAGFDLCEADLLRRVLGKKKYDEVEIYTDQFIDKAIKNGITKEVAIKIFETMKQNILNCFNKSHAASYALLAYQTAYLKAYYPEEFIASVLKIEKEREE